MCEWVFFFLKQMLQGNHARHVEATKVQVYISLCHLVRFHTDDSVSHCRLLVFWRPATQPLQRLFSPPQERLAWRCRYPNAHSPGSIPIHIYWLYGFALAGANLFTEKENAKLFTVQFITFGFACTPLYFVWEKVIGMHDTKSICLRALARLPVVIPIWFLAIIFPFFGPINSAVGALLVSFTVYIIPSLAHMLTYRKASARQVKNCSYLDMLMVFWSKKLFSFVFSF